MRRTIVALVSAGAIVGCSQKPPPAPQEAAPATAISPPAANSEGASGSGHRVKLTPGQGADVMGTLDLVASEGAVTITGQVSGLKPGSVHGVHIHEKGDCSSPDFKSAGAHFNPTQQQHGDPATPPHHLGDIPNLEADAEGKATVNARIEGATLGDGSPNDLVGRAVVVHADRDDYKTQPAGNSGDRIACGVIQ